MRLPGVIPGRGPGCGGRGRARGRRRPGVPGTHRVRRGAVRRDPGRAPGRRHRRRPHLQHAAATDPESPAPPVRRAGQAAADRGRVPPDRRAGDRGAAGPDGLAAHPGRARGAGRHRQVRAAAGVPDDPRDASVRVPRAVAGAPGPTAADVRGGACRGGRSRRVHRPGAHVPAFPRRRRDPPGAYRRQAQPRTRPGIGRLVTVAE